MTEPIAREQRALLPCDYCGSTTGAEPIKDNRKLWAVRCSCGLHSTWHTRRYGAIEAWNERIERHRLSSVKSAAFADAQPPRENSHPDDAAVDLFAAQMKAKLAVARTKGRGGWDDPSQCSVETLRTMLHGHIGKGDPVDVANFCMMLAHYSATTAQPPREEVAVPVGMVPYGPDHPDYPNPPSDWNGKRVWLGQAEQEWAGSEDHLFSDLISWRHGKPGVIPVRAYTPTPPAGEVAAPVQLSPSDRERMHAVWDNLADHLGHEAAAIAPSTAAPVQAEVERDAARWRALWSSDRIRMMGCAGFDFAEDGAVTVRAGDGWAHMGMEVWDKHPAKGDDSDTRGRKVLLAYVDAALASLPTTEATGAGEGPIVPPENGETDPEWRAIRRAIDQFAGRVPTIGKHRAINNAHLAAVVERLDAAGDREAADTIVWQAWHRASDRERERFLLDDARATLARSSDGE